MISMPIPPSTAIQRKRGFSLVELMVAIVIGLILLGALSYILIGSRLLGRTEDDASRMQENGRYAMELIGKAARHAGYRLDPELEFNANPAGTPALPIQGTDGGGSGATASPDTLTVRHDPAWIKDTTWTAGNPDPMKGQETNCVGTSITSNNTAAKKSNREANSNLIVYIFSISNNQLRCSATAGSTGSVMVDGVENMQVEYGIDTAGNGIITSYVNAGAVTNFAQVAAVRVSLLLRGTNQGTAANRSQTLRFNGEDRTFTDGLLRQVYTSTFTVRNQAK